MKSLYIFRDMDILQSVLLTHGDFVDTVADGFKVIALCNDLVSGLGNDHLRIYGLQFHPEVDLTKNGKKIFSNFLYEIVGLSGTYTMLSRETECLQYIRDSVGSKKAILLISGGVDSCVCAALLQRALGRNQIVCIHIDNGFMRQDESDNVLQTLTKIGIDVTVITAWYHFRQGNSLLGVNLSAVFCYVILFDV